MRGDPPHNGTATSRDAAISMRPHAETLRQMILDYIAMRGETGATCDEVEVALSLTHQCASARITELHAPRQGTARIHDSKRTRPTRSGRGAVVWVAVPVQTTIFDAFPRQHNGAKSPTG